MIRGILFDIDGVIVDSEPFLAEACRLFFAEKGCSVTPADFLPYVGAGENKYIGCVAEKYGISIEIESAKIEVYRIYDRVARGLTGFGKMPPMPGILRFIGNARKAGLKTALASSADRMKVEINIKSAGLDIRDFDFLINGSQIERKKPFGDIYEAAARNIGLDCSECLVVEDAVNGVQAGKNAGCLCLAVTGTFSIEQLKAAGADLAYRNIESFPVFDTLEDFNGKLDRELAASCPSHKGSR